LDISTAHPPKTIFSDKMLNSIVLGHFMVDFLNGQRSLLLAYLSILLGLSNYGLGIITSLYVIIGALAQPFFGYFSDRIGARWVAAGGVLLMGVFFSTAMFFPGWPALGLLILASICSGAFHPAGAMQATLAGRERLQGREATAASLFFLFGQMGYGIGPMIGGPLLDLWGMPGLLLISAMAFPIGGFAANQLKYLPKPVKKEKSDTTTKFIVTSTVALTIGIAALQSWSQSNISVFMPRFLAGFDMSPAIYGVIIGLFTAGSAIGCMVGGELADRYGKKAVISGSLLLAVIPLTGLAAVGNSIWIYPLMFLSGFLTGGPFSVIVVQAQKVIPGGMGLASGLTLGFIFSSGSLGTMFTGLIADAWGYQPVFFFTAAIALAGGLLSLYLKDF
jgi:FSR family fosmidomycin resistance protein-like MFS transporter